MHVQRHRAAVLTYCHEIQHTLSVKVGLIYLQWLNLDLESRVGSL
jgi:hypothetical protein